MDTKQYNGWTNYATWRINLEILGDIDWEDPVHAEDLQEITEDIVFNNTVEKDCLAADYVRAFLSEVDYECIAKMINEELALQKLAQRFESAKRLNK